MTEGSPVGLSASGPPETVLDPEPDELRRALIDAQAAPPPDRRSSVCEVVARWPRSSTAWAALGDLSPVTMDAYAAYRVGYHRGLDHLRASGWRGSGYVRWQHEGNQGFLRCLAGLAARAAEIGETDEAERCELFLRQLDPGWPPPELSS